MCIRDERFWKMAVACELPGHFSEGRFVTEESFCPLSLPFFAGRISNRRNSNFEGRSLAAIGLLVPEASIFLAMKAVANKRTNCHIFSDIWNTVDFWASFMQSEILALYIFMKKAKHCKYNDFIWLITLYSPY